MARRQLLQHNVHPSNKRLSLECSTGSISGSPFPSFIIVDFRGLGGHHRHTYNMMRSSILRSSRLALSASKASTRTGASRCLPMSLVPQRRADSTLATAPQASNLQHAVSSPMLANVEKRWETMPPAEQAELWMALRKRMKVDNWADMTLQEKKIGILPFPCCSLHPGAFAPVTNVGSITLSVLFFIT